MPPHFWLSMKGMQHNTPTPHASYSRRSFLQALGLVAPAALLASAMPASAFTLIDGADYGFAPPSPAWRTLESAAPSVLRPGAPALTPDLQALLGTRIILNGHVQSLTGFTPSPGSGHLYLLSRLPFHCSLCYAGAATSLVVVSSPAPLPTQRRQINLSGILVQRFMPAATSAQLAPAAPSLFFELQDATVAG